MKQLKQIINKVVEWTSIGLVVVMVLLVLWQVVARYLLNNPSSFSEALTRYLFVWLVLITSTYAFGSRDHMYIAALNDKLKDKTKTVRVGCSMRPAHRVLLHLQYHRRTQQRKGGCLI